MEEITLVKCETGYLFRAKVPYVFVPGGPPPSPVTADQIWAFSTIDEAAKWLTDRYCPIAAATMP